ncbi:hypothetical protein ACFS6H_04110 [Terrimonas rubra]|uniref:Uncharacterized protein n=1 Tax=Terrimonas rubra TaxID=1035890 RepID=A0ABW6A2B4_9BACT
MNKTEARQLMMKYLIPRIEQYGFKERGKATDFQIVRKVDCGEDVINGGLTDYNPEQQIIYNFYKRHKSIIELLMALEKKGISLSPPISKHTGTIGFSYETINGILQIGYLPTMKTEHDVEKCVGLITDFMETTAIPLLDKFEDLREIDRMINGKTPWETDADKPYRFGGNFHLKRLIVSKLAGLGTYDRTLNFIRENYTSHFNDKYGDDYKQALQHVEELNNILEGVMPIY